VYFPSYRLFQPQKKNENAVSKFKSDLREGAKRENQQELKFYFYNAFDKEFANIKFKFF